MMDLRPVGYVVGLVILVLGLAMLLPLAVDWGQGNGNAPAFAEAAILSVASGGFVALACANARGNGLGVRQAFLLTLGIWILVPVFAALPLMLGQPGVGPTDAYFEAVSGITTTGATVLTGLDRLPAGVNLWRGMLNWLGGLGIAFVAMIFLPVMRVGGMQFFRTEGFDTLGKVLPRASDIARALLIVYAGLTLAAGLVYGALGMSTLDATVHAMASISTGGFSASDKSFAKYPGAAEYAGGLFVILAALPYIRYVQMLNGQAGPLMRDEQVRAFLRWLAYAIGAVTLWRWQTSDMGFEPALRESWFNLISIFTGTGFGSGSFSTWGGFAMIVATLVGFIGGCSSSSSAALSVFRVQVMHKAVVAQIKRIHAPHRIVPIRYEGRVIEPEVLDPIIMYVYSFVILCGAFSVAMTLVGLDFESAFFAAWTSIGNIGYGFGPIVARTGTFVDVPTGAKWLMILAMLMGRLSLMAFLVVLVPRFWRG